MKPHVMTASRNAIAQPIDLSHNKPALTVYCTCGFCTLSPDSQLAVDSIVLAHKIDVILTALGIDFTEPDLDIKAPTESRYSNRGKSRDQKLI